MKLLNNTSLANNEILFNVPGVFNFLDLDCEKIFYKNKKYFSKNKIPWRYNTEKVNYTLNSQGYRCPEFSEIHWHESILFFGCSHIFGTGVDDTHTIPHFVKEKTGIPCINLGIPGSSTMAQIYNAEVLHKHNVKPQGIVILYPQPLRYTIFDKKNRFNNLGPWNFDKNNCNFKSFLSVLLSNDTHIETIQRWNQYLFRSFWDCPVFEFAHSYDQSELKYYSKNSIKMLTGRGGDKARDCAHAGPLSNEKAAESIIEDMKTRGFL